MSLINDYTTYITDHQRRSELMAEAAQNRLARGIRTGSTSWWRRLVGGRADRSAPAGVRTHAHRVAH